MQKKILQLDSQQLSAFQRCPQKFMLSFVLGIEPQVKAKALSRGSYVAKWLQAYHHWKLKGKNWHKLINPIINVSQKRFGIEDGLEIANLLVLYFKEYKNEDWQPLAVEKGFSFILYEDNQVCFIYEGRPDLIARTSKNDIVAVDHKTQSMKYDIYPFNNQAIGYCIAANAKYFVYNYLKFTKTDQFRRTPFIFDDDQKKEWKEQTIQWYFDILRARENARFLKALTCQDKFGVCEFSTICESPDDFTKLHKIKMHYKQKPKRWKAW